MKPFDIFICHKKSSGKDFADHLKAGLEELGYHSFLDSKDIPKMTNGTEEWIQIRDRALKESKIFILIITPGFDLSHEVRKEIKMARETSNKQFLYFRHRDLGRKIVVDLENEKIDLGRQEQVSFENKEELLRLAAGILLKEGKLSNPQVSEKNNTSSEPKSQVTAQTTNPKTITKTAAAPKAAYSCEMCSKPLEGQPYVETIDDTKHIFHNKECAQTYKKLKSLYGESFR
jgi:hypothetical protein